MCQAPPKGVRRSGKCQKTPCGGSDGTAGRQCRPCQACKDHKYVEGPCGGCDSKCGQHFHSRERGKWAPCDDNVGKDKTLVYNPLRGDGDRPDSDCGMSLKMLFCPTDVSPNGVAGYSDGSRDVTMHSAYTL